MASDDLLEGVEEEILPLGVLVNLREDEGKIALEISSTHTPWKHKHKCLYNINLFNLLQKVMYSLCSMRRCAKSSSETTYKLYIN